MDRFELSTLMAYADGEIDAETAREVEAQLAESPEDRDTVDALRRSAELARAALNAPLNEPVPERLLAAANAVPSARPVARPPWRLLAATLAGLALGVGGTVAGLHGTGQPTGAVLTAADLSLRDGTLQRSLEKTVSGTEIAWQNPDSGHSGVIVPVRTTQRADGTFCREYRETTTIKGVAGQSYGIACRQPDGFWKVRYEILPKDEESGGH